MIHSSRSSPILARKELLLNASEDIVYKSVNNIKANDMKTQTHEINQYLIKLLSIKIKELQDYESKIKKIKHFANSDVEQLVDSLLHNMNDTDKEMYKTGAKFMKQTVSTILSE